MQGMRSILGEVNVFKGLMTSAREQLLDLLAINSFRLGEFTLSSGGKSDYYIDCRTTTLHSRGAELTGRVFLDLIRQEGWQAHAVGGLTMGADPIVVAISVISSQAERRFMAFWFARRKKRTAWAAVWKAFSKKARAW